MKAKTYDSVGFPRDDGCGVFVRTVDHVEIVEYAERLRKALDEIDDLIDGEVDVRDGEDGPRPNTAMSIRSIIDALQMPERATVMRVRLPLAGRDSVRKSWFDSSRFG